MGAEKVIVSKLMVPQTDKRIYATTRQTGLVCNGVIPDGRNVMYRGRKEAQEFKNMFGMDITGKVLSERLGGYFHQHTCYYGYRPFGTSVLVAAFDPVHFYTLH